MTARRSSGSAWPGRPVFSAGSTAVSNCTKSMPRKASANTSSFTSACFRQNCSSSVLKRVLTGTVTAKASFDNRTNALWPGEYVRVSVELEVDPNATAVPTRAVLAGQEGNYVFVVGNDRIAKVRPVTPGRIVGTYTTIDKGLALGEHVVVDGQSRLTPDAHVDLKAEKGGGGSPVQAGSGR